MVGFNDFKRFFVKNLGKSWKYVDPNRKKNHFLLFFFSSPARPQLDTQLPDRPTVPAKNCPKKVTHFEKKNVEIQLFMLPMFPPTKKFDTLIEGDLKNTQSPMSMCSQLLAVAKGAPPRYKTLSAKLFVVCVERYLPRIVFVYGGTSKIFMFTPKIGGRWTRFD